MDFVTSQQTEISAFSQGSKNTSTHFFNAKDYETVKLPSNYIWVTVNQGIFQAFYQHEGDKINKYKTFSKHILSLSLKTEQKWAPPFNSILWSDAFNLRRLTYWSFSCYCNCFQKNLNNPSANSWWVPFANIKVSKNFLYHMMGILCLLKNKQNERLHLWLP